MSGLSNFMGSVYEADASEADPLTTFPGLSMGCPSTGCFRSVLLLQLRLLTQ